MLLRFPAQSKTRRRHRGARPTLTRGLALVTLKYRRMMLAHRLHDLSRTSPPTLIGGQADRGSSRGTVQRDASGYRLTERGIGRIHRRRSASTFFPPKAPFTYSSKTNDCIRAPLARTPYSRPTSRCRIAFPRELVRAGIRGPEFRVQLTSWSADPSSSDAQIRRALYTAQRRGVPWPINLPIRSRSLNFLPAAVIVTRKCYRRLLPPGRLLRSPTVSWRPSNEASC
jgi:hypothetical protein